MAIEEGSSSSGEEHARSLGDGCCGSDAGGHVQVHEISLSSTESPSSRSTP